MGNAINPLLVSVCDALQAIILTIHNEDFSRYGFLLNPFTAVDLREYIIVCTLEKLVSPLFLYSHSNEPPEAGQAEAQCSLYMKELQQFILRAQNFYLKDFECLDFIMDRLVNLNAENNEC